MTEEIPAEVNWLATMAIGEKAEVAQAVQAPRQHIAKEATNELMRVQTHDLLSAGSIAAVVLPTEGDVIVIDLDDAAVGDGDAMGRAAETGEYLSGTAEGRLGIDDPVGPPSLREITGEGGWFVEMDKPVGEAQVSPVEGTREGVGHEPP